MSNNIIIMLSCIMFRMNYKEYKKNNNSNVIDDKSNKDYKIPECKAFEPIIEDNKKTSILNMVNKEYMRLEKIRLEKDKLINLQDKLINLQNTCKNEQSDIIYYRNLYIMEEDKINKHILQLLEYLK
mgnify:CR=1 FL=1